MSRHGRLDSAFILAARHLWIRMRPMPVAARFRVLR